MGNRVTWDTDGPGAFLVEHRDELIRLLDKCDLVPEVHMRDSRRMDSIRDGSVQLVVTSPPYPYIEMWDRLFEAALGLGPGGMGASADHFDAAHGYLGEVWHECHRILAEGGILAIDIGDATRTVGGDFRCFHNHSMVTATCESLGFQSLVPVLWKKPTNKPNSFLGSGFYPSNGYVTLDCEFILLFRKGGKRAFPPKDPLRYASQFSKAERDVWFSQVWDVRGERQDGSAAFPAEIPYRLIRMFSILGDTVVDPFLGTGQTVRVARRLGRKAVGYEDNHSLARKLKERVDAEPPAPSDVIDGLLSLYARRGAGSASPKLFS